MPEMIVNLGVACPYCKQINAIRYPMKWNHIQVYECDSCDQHFVVEADAQVTYKTYSMKLVDSDVTF